jgi:hypothetical protein
MPLSREAVVTTFNARGEPYIAPLGLIAEGEGLILAPFRPSKTLDNLRQAPFGVATLPMTCASSQDASPGAATGR